MDMKALRLAVDLGQLPEGLIRAGYFDAAKREMKFAHAATIGEFQAERLIAPPTVEQVKPVIGLGLIDGLREAMRHGNALAAYTIARQMFRAAHGKPSAVDYAAASPVATRSGGALVHVRLSRRALMFASFVSERRVIERRAVEGARILANSRAGWVMDVIDPQHRQSAALDAWLEDYYSGKALAELEAFELPPLD